jgi:DNA-binding IclR family transcriptional regulator
MERNEVSLHEARIFTALERAGGWLTNREIAQAAGVAGRTARAHSLRLVRLGILDLAEVFPAHRYRLSEKAAKRNAAYFQRLRQACEVFGIAPSA